MIWEALSVWNLAVDRDACMGHARCVGLAPELFTLDDDGISVPIETVVGETEVVAARAAALACPERAIHVTMEGVP